MAADETHHVKMLDDVSVFGDSDSGTARPIVGTTLRRWFWRGKRWISDQ